jgi:hypothetical protein
MTYYSTDGLISSISGHFHHGLLVIEDVSSDDVHEHDDWDPSIEPIHVEGRSVYAAVIPAIEGIVTVDLVKATHVKPFAEGFMLALSDPIQFNHLFLGDPNRSVSISLAGGVDGNQISHIYVDSVDNIKHVVVAIS